MRFDLDGLDVFFPYERLYLEQFQYMKALKQTLDASYQSSIAPAGTAAQNDQRNGRGSHCLLEMPTGTGKTVCLLSLITSYQFAYPDRTGKLVYCTRTVPEMNSVMHELGVVLAYRAEQLRIHEEINESSNEALSQKNLDASGINQSTHDAEMLVTTTRTVSENASNSKDDRPKRKRKIYSAKKVVPAPLLGQIPNAGGSGVLALCLSSRRNMCVHDRVVNESDREAVDSACRNMTASWVLEKAKQVRSVDRLWLFACIFLFVYLNVCCSHCVPL